MTKHPNGYTTDISANGSSKAAKRKPTVDATPDWDNQKDVVDASGSRALRVLCVDDHPMLVEGLRAQFSIDGKIKVIGRLATAARLVEEVERLRPDGVLLDIEMPGPDAFEAADRLRRVRPEVRVMILSGHVRDAFITASFAAGACAYFSKSDDLADLVMGIRAVLKSRTSTFVMGPLVKARCRALPTARAQGARHAPLEGPQSDVAPGTPVTLLSSLTTREVDVLRLIGKGLSRVQIAAQMSRSAKTIDGHQDRMMKKLGIASRADLMRFAIREGLATA